MPNGRERALLVAQLALAAFLAGGLFLNFGIGLADNGDFTRAVSWLTSGPATIEPNWPPPGSEAYRRRFHTYWIPYWKLDWPLQLTALSSTGVLWLPGVALNWLFYSRRMLYLPFVSLVPRVCLVLLYVALLRWSGWRTAGRATRWVGATLVGIPLALLFMAQDYVAYFSSFYRDTGSIVFLLLFLASLVMLDTSRHERRALILATLSLTLLATAKVTNVYWPLLAFPFLLLARGGRRSAAAVCGAALLSAAVALAFFRRAELPEQMAVAHYSSLYTGLLQYSSRPADHLARLGLHETGEFVGKSCYLPETSRWLEAHVGRLSIGMTLDVLVHEPSAFLRELRFAASAMHYTAHRLGMRAEGDPTPPTRRSFQQLWCLLKVRAFPRGGALAVALGVFAAVFLSGLRADPPLRQLSLVGLLATVAVLVEMVVATLGGGTLDLVRHLLMANYLFDLALIAFGTSCALHLVGWARRRVFSPGPLPPSA